MFVFVVFVLFYFIWFGLVWFGLFVCLFCCFIFFFLVCLLVCFFVCLFVCFYSRTICCAKSTPKRSEFTNFPLPNCDHPHVSFAFSNCSQDSLLVRHGSHCGSPRHCLPGYHQLVRLERVCRSLLLASNRIRKHGTSVQSNIV
jgi:hypothetical protein